MDFPSLEQFALYSLMFLSVYSLVSLGMVGHLMRIIKLGWTFHSGNGILCVDAFLFALSAGGLYFALKGKELEPDKWITFRKILISGLSAIVPLNLAFGIMFLASYPPATWSGTAVWSISANAWGISLVQLIFYTGLIPVILWVLYQANQPEQQRPQSKFDPSTALENVPSLNV